MSVDEEQISVCLLGSFLSSFVFSWCKEAPWPSCEVPFLAVVTCGRSPGKYRLGNTPQTCEVKTLGILLANDYSKLEFYFKLTRIRVDSIYREVC